MDDKTARLEEKIAFLEQALTELSEEHYAQQKELDRLAHQVLLLTEKLKNQSDSSDYLSENALISDEKPPHY